MIELNTSKDRPDLASSISLDGESLSGVPRQKRASVVQHLQQAESELVQEGSTKA